MLLLAASRLSRHQPSDMLRRPRALLLRRLPRFAVRALSSTGGKPPPASDPLEGKNAFRGMPGSSASLPGLLLILSLVVGYNAFCDYYAPPSVELQEETDEERVARLLRVESFEVARVMSDGRVLMRDGSIRASPDTGNGK